MDYFQDAVRRDVLEVDVVELDLEPLEYLLDAQVESAELV